MRNFPFLWVVFLIFAVVTVAFAGPYDEPGIAADDPAIIGWATGYLDYLPADNVSDDWQAPERALGPATGDHTDAVSLGELEAESPGDPGEITLTFDVLIQDQEGYDLAVFENGFPAGEGLFAELAYVEVSTDGATWARFPSVSLIEDLISLYQVVDPTDIFQLGGKHPNAYGMSEGTPFDLAELAETPAVVEGLVDLDEINFVKIVDVPGSGEYFDQADFYGYDEPHPIYDAYPTYDSGGFDLEAVGVLNEAASDDDQADDDAADDDDQGLDDDDDDDSDGCGL